MTTPNFVTTALPNETPNTMGEAVENLATGLDNMQGVLTAKVGQLADTLDSVAKSAAAGDVGNVNFSDGDVLMTQHTIGQLSKAAEGGVATYGKAENASKTINKQITQM